MSVILVIQPDAPQAKVLRDVSRRIGADLVVVDSVKRAVDAIGRHVPDLILLSAFLSPRDEDTLMATLRSLEGTSHLQTLSIPQFRSAEEAKGKKSGFGFRKKQKPTVALGADPAAFADEVIALLLRATEIRNRPAPPEPIETVIAQHLGAWSTSGATGALGASGATGAMGGWGVIEEPTAIVEEATEEQPFESVIAPNAPSKPALSIADEINQLVCQLGIDLGPTVELSAPSEIVADDGDVFDFGASLDRARNAIGLQRPDDVSLPHVDANAIREAALAEARAAAEREAREALAADLIRVQAEAEQMRETAIAEARAVAEREARETLAIEVARVRSEAESTLTDALHKAKAEAEENERRRIEAERLKMEAERARVERINAEAQQAFARELARVRAEVEQSLAVQLDAARKEAERIRAADAEAIRERAAVEAQLKSELDRLRFVTAQTRKADESENKKAAQQIKQLEAELANVRAKTESHKGDELEDIRAQMAELREAAAQHARAAAAEAVAAEVARATARPTAVVAQFPVRQVVPIEPAQDEESDSQAIRDYLSVWQSNAVAPPVAEDVADADESEESPISASSVRRHAKWALPVAACLVIVVNTGPAISTLTWLVKREEAPRTVVQPMHQEPPFIEVVEKRVGRLQLNSTPPGAEAIVDGKRYGKTPVTIFDLDVGLHTLELKGSTGTITRKVTIKANQTTLLTESIFSGWLAIFSPIPLKVIVDGKAVNLSDDGRVMTTPGEHVVEFINEQFNFRAVETFSLRPGETVAHTVVLPTGTVRVVVPEGAEVKVDGQPPAGNPTEGLSLVIGAHEISATHPQFGERRAAIDVTQGGLTEVNLQFEQ